MVALLLRSGIALDRMLSPMTMSQMKSRRLNSAQSLITTSHRVLRDGGQFEISLQRAFLLPLRQHLIAGSVLEQISQAQRAVSS